MLRWSLPRLRRAAAQVLAAGLKAADPETLIRRNLRIRGSAVEVGGRAYRLRRGRIVLLAVGKAAGRMARAAEERLGPHLSDGLAIDVSAHVRLKRVRLHVAGHPVPDGRGAAAAQEVE